MDTIQVTHGRVDKGLKRRRRDALEDARGDEARIPSLGVGGAPPCACNGQQQCPANEKMSLAPDATSGHKNKGREAHAEEIPSRQLGDLRKLLGEVERQRKCVGGEDGTERRCKDGRQGQDEGDEVSLPQGPVEGIVRVVGRLRDEDDGDGAAGVVFEAVDAVGGILRSVGVVKISSGACDDGVSGCVPLVALR